MRLPCEKRKKHHLSRDNSQPPASVSGRPFTATRIPDIRSPHRRTTATDQRSPPSLEHFACTTVPTIAYFRYPLSNTKPPSIVFAFQT